MNKNSNKKICLFLHNLSYGGAEKVVITLANYLDLNDFDVTILTLKQKNDYKSLINSSVKHISLDINRIRSSIMPLFSFLRANKFDIMFSNIWPLTSISLISRIANPKIRLFLIEHCNLTEEFKSKNIIFKFMQMLSIFLSYRFSNQVISVSEGVRDDLIKKGVPKNKVSVIYNPLFNHSEHSTISYASVLELWKKSPGIKLISVGELKKQKNFLNLIKALNILNKKNDQKFYLLILGDGEQRNEIEKLSNSLNLKKYIFMPGWVENPTLYLKKADLFVLPSNYEGFGLVIIEAMSVGLNVVSTDCKSGPSEILKRGEYGFLCEVDSPQSLANKILESMENLINSSILENRSKDFSVEVIGKKYIGMINDYLHIKS